jgi:putative ABC transport system substrate-binding protein
MRRRAFMAALAGWPAWPLLADAQPVPVVGYIGPEDDVVWLRRGLNEEGYTEGRNVTIEVRLLSGKLDDVRELVAELLARKVSVIVSITPGALAAKAASSTVPIVFATGGDPVALGLVASLNRPGGNLTGVSFLGPLMEPKRLGLLHEMVQQTDVIAILLNRNGPLTETQLKEINEAAHTLGLDLYAQQVAEESEFDGAFSAFAKARAGALLVGADPFFYNQRNRLIAQAAKNKLPAMYGRREFVEAGGLMSYGTTLAGSFRQVGVYVGKILKGAKPSDLPVLQTAKCHPACRPAPTRSSNESARVHRGARRCGGVADGGAGAAVRADAAHRRAQCACRGRSGSTVSYRGVPTRAAGIGLDRWPQRADRHSLGYGRCRSRSQARGGISCARTRRYPDHWRRVIGTAAAGDPHRSHRVRERARPCRCRLRR